MLPDPHSVDLATSCLVLMELAYLLKSKQLIHISEESTVY